MNFPSLPVEDETAELRTCLRDLVGLLGLPALWSTREPLATVRMLAETLVETISLDVCYVTTNLSTIKEPLSFFYVDGKPIDIAEEEWHSFIEVSSRQDHALTITEEDTPVGKLRTARFSLGYYGQSGQITVAARRPEFPKPTELIILRSAASLAASGLRTARLTYERERALRAKDEFLAMLGHELRNPLAPIVTALELLKIKGIDKLAPEYVIIERQVKHLEGLVDDLLDITRITAGKVQLKKEVIELHTAIQSAVESARPLIEERNHRLQVDVPSHGLLVKADPLRLSQVILNLLINAAKYTDPEGQITITTYRELQNVSVQVKDNGSGIAPDLLPYIFDLFEQGAVSIDRSRGGLGIGLSVVKSLVAMHGGTISVESAGLGMGSTFTVTLPITQEQKPTSAVSLLPVTRIGRKAQKIVLVDDNRDAADSMGHLLQACGHEVHVYYAPMDALSACEKTAPSVVIVDIGLPVISGYELANLIRSRLRDKPPRIIAVTGYGQAQDRRKSAEAGIEAHFTKPVQIEALLSSIEKAG